MLFPIGRNALLHRKLPVVTPRPGELASMLVEKCGTESSLTSAVDGADGFDEDDGSQCL